MSMLIGHCLRQMVREDREKFSTADRDADDRLSADEYRAFYHPWMQPYMHEYEVTRTLRELDTDNDSRIDLAEFIASAGSVSSTVAVCCTAVTVFLSVLYGRRCVSRCAVRPSLCF